MKQVSAALCCSLVLAGCGGGVASKPSPDGVTEESPGDLYVSMAAAYYQRGQMDAAVDRALQGLAQDRKNPRAHYVLAIIYQRLGKTTEAQKHFAEAVRIEPDNPDFLNARGSMLCLQGKYREALEQYELALNNPLYRTPEVARTNAADCARRAGRGNESERYLREALSTNSKFAPALFAMANLSFDRGAYQDARNYMARYSRVGQVTPAALLLASRIEARLGNTNDAKALAQSLRTKFPDSPEVMQL